MDLKRLEASAALGKRIGALLDTEIEVAGVTSGPIAAHLRVIGPVSAADLRVTAGWGRVDGEGRITPAKGQHKRRKWTNSEREFLSAGFASCGLDDGRALALLGDPLDVYLNNTTHWRGVPERVREYYVGGYQVIKKWLSYREEVLLGRPLETNEARQVTATVRRLSAIVLMSDELDANYTAVRDNPYPLLLPGVAKRDHNQGTFEPHIEEVGRSDGSASH